MQFSFCATSYLEMIQIIPTYFLLEIVTFNSLSTRDEK